MEVVGYVTKMSQGILAFRKRSLQQCPCHKIIVFVVKAQPLGNSRQDVYILHLCLKYDIVVWSRVNFIDIKSGLRWKEFTRLPSFCEV